MTHHDQQEKNVQVIRWAARQARLHISTARYHRQNQHSATSMPGFVRTTVATYTGTGDTFRHCSTVAHVVVVVADAVSII